MKSLEPTEKQIENSIFEALASRHNTIFAFKVNTTGVYDQRKKTFRRLNKWVMPGTADIIACMSMPYQSGYFVAIEVKTKNGKQSEAQKEFQKRVQQHGGIYLLVRSYEDFMEQFDDLTD